MHSPAPRPLLALVLALLFSLVGCGSETVEEIEIPVEEVPELTPEEEKLNAILDNPDVFTPVEEEAPLPEEEAFVLNKASQVSILCYHDFSTSPSSNPMIIQVDKFREQMQSIKDAGIPVVPMEAFLSWRAGDLNLPDPCIVITIDDGWKAVHTIAMPILREFNFPFTVYLYQAYVNTGGRSLSLEEIEDIRNNGGSIGCHSQTHSDMTNRRGKSEEEYVAYLHRELGDSKRFLLESTGVDPTSFAYPFGTYNDQVIETAKEYGYRALFTVNGKRAEWGDPPAELGRFVVHGDNDYNFKLGTSFKGRGNLADNMTLAADGEDLPFDVLPEPEAKIRERRPEISVDLSRMEGVLEETISLRVGGFGRVPASFDPVTRVVSYRVPQVLRNRECLVQFSVRVEGESKPFLLPWRFYIEPNAHYLDPVEEEVEEEEIPEETPTPVGETIA